MKLDAAIILIGCLCAVGSGVAAYRVSGPYGERNRHDPRVTRILDSATGTPQIVIFDADGDGRPDTRAYMDGDRLTHLEIDDDGDGLTDRWEYYAADGTLQRTASSTKHDGRPDTWRDETR